MKKLGVGLMCVSIVLILTASIMAQSPTETLGPMTADFDYWQPGGYPSWGPYHYYGEPVQVHYVATNRWTMTRKDLGDSTYWVRQSLTQIGTAYVYDFTKTTLLDTQPFNVNEQTIGTVTYEADWYHVCYFATVKRWSYHWHIDGIYHYWGKAKDSENPSAYEGFEFGYWVRGWGTYRWSL